LREWLAAQVRVHAAQTAKSSRSDANTFEVRQFDAAVVAHHHVLNVTLTVNESADLAACFVGKLAELTRKLRGDDLIGRYTPSVQLFDAPELIWFKP
jgi:hypothetical protein